MLYVYCNTVIGFKYNLSSFIAELDNSFLIMFKHNWICVKFSN